jgi:hypothetical protein
MAPGMSMGPGESMSDMGAPDASTPAPAGGSGRPSAAARMVCGPEIRHNIGQLLALRPAPVGRATWVDHVYTCTYQLPAGPLVLEVTESRDVSAAHRAFATLRHTLGQTQALTAPNGLGLPAYKTGHGTAVFLEGNKMLRVDATKLAAGTRRQSPSIADVTYEVASGVMRYWAGH